jgi:CheY-like chemotaxis protein
MDEKARKKILVVDDEQDIVKVISLRLKSSGYEVISAVDGNGGINEAQKQKPDLIIMDIMMPDLSGADAVRLLKSDITTKDIPIIFLTALLDNSPKDENDKRVNVDGQFYTAVAKPFEPPNLLFEINKLIG